MNHFCFQTDKLLCSGKWISRQNKSRMTTKWDRREGKNCDNAEKPLSWRTKNMRIRDNGATCRESEHNIDTRISQGINHNKISWRISSLDPDIAFKNSFWGKTCRLHSDVEMFLCCLSSSHTRKKKLMTCAVHEKWKVIVEKIIRWNNHSNICLR